MQPARKSSSARKCTLTTPTRPRTRTVDSRLEEARGPSVRRDDRVGVVAALGVDDCSCLFYARDDHDRHVKREPLAPKRVFLAGRRGGGADTAIGEGIAQLRGGPDYLQRFRIAVQGDTCSHERSEDRAGSAVGDGAVEDEHLGRVAGGGVVCLAVNDEGHWGVGWGMGSRQQHSGCVVC